MTLEQSNAFWEKGKIVAGDMNGDIITSIDNTPDFAGQSVTNKNLTDKLTENQLLNRMNPATVNGVLKTERPSLSPWNGRESKWKTDSITLSVRYRP